MERAARIVVTGTDWMGHGITSIETAINDLFRQAEHEIMITAYSVTSGADLLFEWLEEALIRGVRVHMLINRFSQQEHDVQNRLLSYTRTYPHIRLFNFASDEEADLHAKTIVVDRAFALIGSSNLSRRGMLRNHELGVLVEGRAASQAAQALDRLFTSRHVIEVSS